MEQLAFDYHYAMERVDIASKRIASIKETWSGQEKAIKGLERKFNEASKQKDLHRKIKNLKAQILWSMVKEKEDEFGALNDLVAKRKARLEEYEAERDKIVGRTAGIEEEIAALQEEAASFGPLIEPLQTEYSTINRNVLGKKDDLKRVTAQLKEMIVSMNEENANLKRLDSQIEEELRRNDDENQTKLSLQIGELESTIEKINAALGEARQKDSEIRAKRGQSAEKVKKAKDMLEEASNKLTEKRHQLDMVNRAKGNRLKMFGERMPDLIKDIERNAGQFHRAPLGPIGMYVELKEKQWALPVEVIIGKELESFVVKDQHDHDLLLSMFRKYNLRCPICILQSDAPLDISRGQPDPKFATALRAIDVKHPLALKALVIQTSLEKAVLMETRNDAKDVLRRHLPNVESAFTPSDRVFVKYEWV